MEVVGRGRGSGGWWTREISTWEENKLERQNAATTVVCVVRKVPKSCQGVYEVQGKCQVKTRLTCGHQVWIFRTSESREQLEPPIGGFRKMSLKSRW